MVVGPARRRQCVLVLERTTFVGDDVRDPDQ